MRQIHNFNGTLVIYIKKNLSLFYLSKVFILQVIGIQLNFVVAKIINNY